MTCDPSTSVPGRSFESIIRSIRFSIFVRSMTSSRKSDVNAKVLRKGFESKTVIARIPHTDHFATDHLDMEASAMGTVNVKQSRKETVPAGIWRVTRCSKFRRSSEKKKSGQLRGALSIRSL